LENIIVLSWDALSYLCILFIYPWTRDWPRATDAREERRRTAILGF